MCVDQPAKSLCTPSVKGEMHEAAEKSTKNDNLRRTRATDPVRTIHGISCQTYCTMYGNHYVSLPFLASVHRTRSASLKVQPLGYGPAKPWSFSDDNTLPGEMQTRPQLSKT